MLNQRRRRARGQGLQLAKRSALDETHGPDWPLPRDLRHGLAIFKILQEGQQGQRTRGPDRRVVVCAGQETGDCAAGHVVEGEGGSAQGPARGLSPKLLFRLSSATNSSVPSPWIRHGVRAIFLRRAGPAVHTARMDHAARDGLLAKSMLLRHQAPAAGYRAAAVDI